MSSFKIELKGLEKVRNEIKSIPKNAAAQIKNSFDAYGYSVVATAKSLAPVDESALKQSISHKVKKEGTQIFVEIVVNVFYASFLEFGTKKFAAKYVSTLPQEWQEFARQFKGSGGGGSFAELVDKLTQWVHRKGLGSGFGGKIGVTGTYSVKTRRRTGNKQTQGREDRQAAYVIALFILKNGIKPQPFLRPAIEQHKPQLINDLNNIF